MPFMPMRCILTGSATAALAILIGAGIARVADSGVALPQASAAEAAPE